MPITARNSSTKPIPLRTDTEGMHVGIPMKTIPIRVLMTVT
jgi:hypothetical protein